jgi:hypothetical protein
MTHIRKILQCLMVTHSVPEEKGQLRLTLSMIALYNNIDNRF